MLCLKTSLLALFTWLLLLPSSCAYSWTRSEWLGVVEAVAGTAVLRPTKTPAGDTCENCSGTGRLGDGVVSVECPVCDGTGKTPGPSRDSIMDCPQCRALGRMEPSPSAPGKEGSAATHDAHQRGGATSSRRGIFKRR